jgi:3-oxoacyl-[acyl-carrier protein] reductase
MAEIKMNDVEGFKGKRVVITGASRGLGQVAAGALAKAGARLLLAARSADRLEEIRASLAAPDTHAIHAADLSNAEEVEGLARAADAFGETDVILHVMGGGLGLRDPLLNWEEFSLLFRTNVASAVEINRMIIPSMVKRGAGNVVHVGSIAGREATGSVGYNSVKAALAAYIRSLGRELADTGVVVTGISPGGFVAPENSWVRFKDRDPALLEQVIAERQPRKKLGSAEEIIPMIMFLASRQATMMTGCCVPIDGGEGLGYS